MVHTCTLQPTVTWLQPLYMGNDLESEIGCGWGEGAHSLSGYALNHPEAISSEQT